MAEVNTEMEKTDRSEASADGNFTIEAIGISKSFGDRKAVDDLSFKIRSGEVVGFLGPNGAGKSTTMRLLTSYYTQDSGTILINGVDTQEQDTVTRRSIGYLPENNPLYGDLLVKEYLSFVADLRGMSPSERRENLDNTIEETSLQEVYYRPINQLSKGYRQRVGLAQAILHRPSILIMDEPTEGLDPNQRLTMRELIRSLGQDRTVLLSTHVMQEVETTCERVLLISRGKLIIDSSVEDLLVHAKGMRSIHVEVEGNEVETALKRLPDVTSVDRLAPVDGRKRYVVSVSGETDIRPEIFSLAKSKDWVLWELHEDKARLEDVFHSLTAETADEEDEG
ncbi:MAG: ATP-binding cassette domain-containing protein [Chloroflexi bacterium]|nr:ATP-binding cassette domain-containing protein [Chloroflexota bacterium]